MRVKAGQNSPLLRAGRMAHVGWIFSKAASLAPACRLHLRTVRKYLLLFLLMLAPACRASEESAAFLSLEKRLEIAHDAYAIRLVYTPVFLHGESRPEAVYKNPALAVEISGYLFSEPLRELLKIVAKEELTSIELQGRWAVGVTMVRRETSEKVFSLEMTVPSGAMAINGKIYKITPAVADWFDRFLLPTAKELNKGYNKTDRL